LPAAQAFRHETVRLLDLPVAKRLCPNVLPPGTPGKVQRPFRSGLLFGSLPPAGVCYRALRRLPGQDSHLLEPRVFEDAPLAAYSTQKGTDPSISGERRELRPFLFA